MYLVSKGDQNFWCPFLFSSNGLHCAKCIKEHFLFQCTLDVHDPIGFPIITQTKGSFYLLILWWKHILDEYLFGLVLLQKATNRISGFGFTFANLCLKIYTNVLGKYAWKELLRVYSPNLAVTFQVCASRISTISISQETAQNATTVKSKKLYINLMCEHLPYMLLQQGLCLQTCLGGSKYSEGSVLLSSLSTAVTFVHNIDEKKGVASYNFWQLWQSRFE